MKSFVLLSLTLTLAVVSSKDFHGKINTTLLQERIINGHVATEGQFPYQVVLYLSHYSEDVYLCSGSLIDWEWILTTAGCLTNIYSVEVRLGSIFEFDNSFYVNVDREDFIIHEDYVDIYPFYNDIALIKIPKDWDLLHYSWILTPNVKEIDLPKKSSSYPDYVGKNGIFAGWGLTTTAHNSASKILQYANMTVINNTECYDIHIGISSKQICARVGKGSACGGDNGSPLVLEEPKVLIGVLSFVDESCADDLPNVFTRVTSYLDWIAEKTGIEI